MGATINLFTVEEFLELPEQEGVKQELSDGVIIEHPMPKFVHEEVKASLIEILVQYALSSRVGRVYVEARFVVGEGRAYEPDLAFVSMEMRRGFDPQRTMSCSPDLAIEVVSWEPATFIRKKVLHYLAGGSKAVWIAYPEFGEIHVWRPNEDPRVFSGESVVEEPSILPGLKFPAWRAFQTDSK